MCKAKRNVLFVFMLVSFIFDEEFYHFVQVLKCFEFFFLLELFLSHLVTSDMFKMCIFINNVIKNNDFDTVMRV